MRVAVKSFFLIIFLISCRSFAYKASEGNVTASYGLFLYKTNFTGSDDLPTSPLQGDFGLVTNGDLTENGSLEIGLFHMNKIFYRNLNQLSLVEKTQMLHIMMGYRRWVSEKFSLGLGFYSEYPLGEYKIIHSDQNVDKIIDTSARDTVETGFDFSIQQEIWSRDHDSIFADFRYSYSISNKENEKGDHYTLFLAYRTMVQEKNSQPSAPSIAPDQIIEPRNDAIEPGPEIK